MREMLDFDGILLLSWELFHAIILREQKSYIAYFAIHDSSCSSQDRSAKNYTTMRIILNVHYNKISRKKSHM